MVAIGGQHGFAVRLRNIHITVVTTMLLALAL